MTIVRSMRGQMVDMGALFMNNKDAVAITGGGIKMNAKGDIILANGVVKSVEQIEEEQKKIIKEKEKVSLTNSEKMKRFHMKRKFLTPKEIQDNLQIVNKQYNKSDNEEKQLSEIHSDKTIDSDKDKLYNLNLNNSVINRRANRSK